MNGMDASEPRFCFLPARRVVAIGGPDAPKFLGDLLTGNVADPADNGSGYGALLSPQGKVLVDLLLHRRDGGYLADLADDHADLFLQRLGLYKLRAQVEIAERPDLAVAVAWDGPSPHATEMPPDPRLVALGFRGPIAADERPPGVRDAAPADYHAHRIALAVPEAPGDFGSGEVFPHDIALDQLHGVDFRKGCFVGQEVVSRMEHRGTARRRVVAVTGEGPLPAAGTPLLADEREVGKLGSTAGQAGIAIARLDRVGDAVAAGTPITAGEVVTRVELPAWATYDWPSQASTG